MSNEVIVTISSVTRAGENSSPQGDVSSVSAKSASSGGNKVYPKEAYPFRRSRRIRYSYYAGKGIIFKPKKVQKVSFAQTVTLILGSKQLGGTVLCLLHQYS